jgi:hypothetical protein
LAKYIGRWRELKERAKGACKRNEYLDFANGMSKNIKGVY